MRSLRWATTPRIWARSRHGGPTNYDGPNPDARPHAHTERLRRRGAKGISATTIVFAALVLMIAGLVAGYEGFMAYRVVLWVLAAVVALGKRDKRREVLGMIAGLAVVAFLLWFFLGRTFYR